MVQGGLPPPFLASPVYVCYFPWHILPGSDRAGPKWSSRSDEHLFKTIRAHAAAKLPPTLGPFRTRSNPTLSESLTQP